MKAKVLFLCMLLCAVFAGCSSDDGGDDARQQPQLSITNVTVAGDWWATEKMVGSQWVPMDSRQMFILTEDGFFWSGDLYRVGKYKITDSGAICYDDKGNLSLVCDFSLLNDSVSEAIISYQNGSAVNVRMKKNNPHSALCRDFATTMHGEWTIENSQSGGTVTIQKNGIAVIEDGDYQFVGSIERSEREPYTTYISGIYTIRPEQIDLSKHPIRFKIEGLPYMPSSGKVFFCVEK